MKSSFKLLNQFLILSFSISAVAHAQVHIQSQHGLKNEIQRKIEVIQKLDQLNKAEIAQDQKDKLSHTPYNSLISSLHLNSEASDTQEPGVEKKSGPEDFCKKDSSKMAACLSALMMFRCYQYATPVLTDIAGCEIQVGHFILTLNLDEFQLEKKPDGDQNKNDLAYVIFKESLISMMRDRQVQNYAQRLKSAIETAIAEQNPFDLYQWTLNFHAGDRDLATRYLAVLFQDTQKRIHMRYLRDYAKATNAYDLNALETHQRIWDVNRLLDPKIVREYSAEIKLYPKHSRMNLENELNPNFYHFYPIAYLAQMMKSRNLGFTRFAFFLSFLFNTEYEFKDLQKSRYPLHPKPFDGFKPELRFKMQDFLSSYNAALWGVERDSKLMNFNEFVGKFSANPFGFMQAAYWRYYFR